MLIELLLKQSGILALVLEGLTLGGLIFALAIVVRKIMQLRPLMAFLQVKGGKMSIIVDNAKNIYFIPMLTEQTFTWIKGFGVRFFEREAMYYCPDLLCNVGIFHQDIAVNLPFHLANAVIENPPMPNLPELPKDIEKKAPEEIRKEINEMLKKSHNQLTQIDATKFIKYLARTLNPLRIQHEIEWRAKVFSTLDNLDKKAAGFNLKKWLPIIIIIAVVGIGLALVLSMVR